MLVDSHVHIHSCFDVEGLLDSALDNFRGAAVSAGSVLEGKAPIGCLALTETARDHAFATIGNGHRRAQLGRWSVRGTSEDAALVLESPANDQILVLAGSQIATAERLEVLALATTKRYPDRRPLQVTLDALVADGVTPVIPWGFGKWWLGRGRLRGGGVSP